MDELAQPANMGVDGTVAAFKIVVEGQGDQLGATKQRVGMAYKGRQNGKLCLTQRNRLAFQADLMGVLV